MAYQIPFTCSNGHNFVANAKLRTKCPECGVMVRRTFQKDDTPQSSETPVIVSADPKPKLSGPVLVRQGKSMPKTVAKTTKTIAKPKVNPKASLKAPTKIAAGLVKTSKVSKGVTPVVKRRPQRSAVSKISANAGGQQVRKSYFRDVMERFGI